MRWGTKMRATAAGLGPGLALLASLAFAGEAPARFEVKSFAEVASPETLLYVEVPDFARAREAYRRTPRWDLWWRGAGRRLISEWIKAEDDEELTSFMRAFAETPKLVDGKLAYVMELPAGDEMDVPGSILLAEAGERAAELEGLFGKMADVDGVEKRERTIGGVRFTETDEFLLLGRAGGLVIGGVGRPAVEGLLARADERPWQSLAASRAFKMARERVGEGSDFFCFANFAEFWKFLRMDMADDEIAMLTRSGLTQLAAVAQGGRFTREGVVDKLTFLLRGRARGMWKLLEPRPLTRRTWKDLPDFTSGFASVKLPLAERAKPFVDLLRSMDPETATDLVDTFAEFRQDTGVSFDKDILPLATGEVTVAFLEEPEKGFLPDPDFDSKTPRLMVLAVELADAAKARVLMDRIARNDDVCEKMRYGDLAGWWVDLGLFEEYYVTGRDGIAYIALAPDPLERLAAHFAKGGARLVDSAEFRQAVAWIPEDTGFVGYSSVRKLLRSVHSLLAAEIDDEMAARVPPAKALMADLTPLTAALRIEKPGFTFDIRSPDGFWAFYMQLAAHITWREEEEMRAPRAVPGRRRPGDPPDAELAKACSHLMKKIAKLKSGQLRIAMLEAALPKFQGTRYEKIIKAMVIREKTVVVRGLFRKTLQAYNKIKRPADRVAFLVTQLPKFAGTAYERTLKRIIERERARIAPPVPEPDEPDDVF